MNKEELEKRLKLINDIHSFCELMKRRVSGTRKEVQNLYDMDYEWFKGKKETNTSCSTCVDRVYNRIKILNYDYENIVKNLKEEIKRLEIKEEPKKELKKEPVKKPTIKKK